jgi:hypothetical protein
MTIIQRNGLSNKINIIILLIEKNNNYYRPPITKASLAGSPS